MARREYRRRQPSAEGMTALCVWCFRVVPLSEARWGSLGWACNECWPKHERPATRVVPKWIERDRARRAAAKERSQDDESKKGH